MQVQEKSDTLVRFQRKLDDLISETSSKQPISRLPERDDDVIILIGGGNGPCYEPEIVKIGLSHGVDWYDTMYEDKYMCLHSFLIGRNETVDRYFMAMENLVERAMKFYKDPRHDSSERYVEMMLLDSCFITELFRLWWYGLSPVDMNVPIFNKMSRDQKILQAVRRDLIRIGNQLPLFVLLEFFDMTRIEGEEAAAHDLVTLALDFFPTVVGANNEIPDRRNIQHLLDVVYNTYVEPSALNLPRNEMMMMMEMEFKELEFINCVTELQEAGVKFKKIKKKMLFDINFKNGVMEIPPLKVADDKLYLLRNLMEYENQFPDFVPRPINDYAKFMQCLVNSPDDVKLLRRSGIIDNWLGNDEVIFNRINNLGSEARISRMFRYSSLLHEVNEHCRHRRNVWMAKLRKNYFNSPWAFLSVLAAIVLLLLTMTQVVFSILSYHHP